MYGSQLTGQGQGYTSPVKDRGGGGGMAHSPGLSPFQQRSPSSVVRPHTPQGVVINNIYQRTAPPPVIGTISSYIRLMFN